MERQEFPVQRTRTLVGSFCILSEAVCHAILRLVSGTLFKRFEYAGGVHTTGEEMPLASKGYKTRVLGYFFAFLSARFSFMVLAGFFFVSFFESWPFAMGILLVNVWCRVSR